MEFHKTLRSLRESKGLTQSELATRCGLHWNAVAQFENGRSPSLRNLVKLADGLQVSLDRLVGRNAE
jgi:transcriptional regulator with XRE-family HTH domain